MLMSAVILFFMADFKQLFRTAVKVLLILLLATAGGLGAIVPTNRERSFDNEVKIELVEKREDDEEEEEEEEKSVE